MLMLLLAPKFEFIQPIFVSPKIIFIMKNAIIFGVVIGALSGLWILVMYLLGFTTFQAASPVEYTSVLIPFIGLYFGVRRFRNVENAGNITFFEGLQESFKILIAGGIVAITIGIIYINYVAKGSINDFSGKIFAAFLVGIIAALAVSLLLMTDSKRVDSK
ncbi:MAG: DUF4199 family protein [Sphingobacteriaceae bacterium]|nr:MAG: DUF4199 family protein [Sphingobacteriaceae bacterium]